MSSCEESGTERETCHSIKKSSPSSSSTNSRDSSPISSKPSRDNLVISEEESETNDIKILPRGYLTALTPDGVLTPPNDGEVSKNGIDDAVKPRRSNGRLEFFKEGVLCLELSHEDEGETTKWLKIKSRSTFPNVVRVTKEVTIPCPSVVPPPMFTSPSHCHGGQSSSRVESCTSHSMSDDGSSVISSESPKLRYRSWRKQPVPQKSVSSSLQFFMKPASCFLNLKRKNGLRIPTKALERHRRRPYVLPDFSNEFDSSPQDADNNKLCVCENEVGKIRSFVAGKNVRSFKPTENGKSKLKFEDMITKLVTGAEEKVRTRKTSEEKSNLLLLKSSSVSPSKSKSTNHSTILPRKRGSKEVEAEESCPPFRPIKKSPSKNQEKTILTVPGVGSVCNKTSSTERHNRILSKSPLNYSSPLPPSMAYGYDATDGNNMDVSVSPSSGDSNRSFRSNGNANTNKLSSKTKSNRSTSRAKKSSSPCSLLKPIPNSVELASTNNVYNNSVHEHQHGSSAITSSTSSSSIPSTVENEETLSPEEQQQFQQQAMSKAISYTINSLLGNGNSNIVSSHNDNRKVDARRTPTKGSIPKTSKSDKSSDVIASSTAALGSLFGVNEQDQNSFLRHLLDTSATIPSSTASSSSPPTTSIKPSHATPKLLERSAINPTNKTKSSSTNPKSRKGTKVGSNNVGTPSSRRNSTNNHVTRADYMSKVVPVTPPASVPIPSEPVHQMSPYGYLIQPQQRPEILSPPVTAFHQQPHHHFGSPHAPLLPAHLSMPKVVPHPYLGHFPAPNFTRLDYSNSNGETALNLSQRGGDWNLPNQNSFDRASNGPQDLSMRRGGSSYSDSMDTSSIDSDVPLNLCKKPRPN